MNVQRTHASTDVFRPDGPDPGSTELWVTRYPEGPGRPSSVGSTWLPSAAERLALAQGAALEVVVAVPEGEHMPPLVVRINPHELGPSPAAVCEEEGHDWPDLKQGDDCLRCGVAFVALFGSAPA